MPKDFKTHGSVGVVILKLEGISQFIFEVWAECNTEVSDSGCDHLRRDNDGRALGRPRRVHLAPDSPKSAPTANRPEGNIQTDSEQVACFRWNQERSGVKTNPSWCACWMHRVYHSRHDPQWAAWNFLDFFFLVAARMHSEFLETEPSDKNQ